MRLLFEKNRNILLLYFSFFVLSLILISITAKSSLHLWINAFHTPFLDALFKHLTWLGDGSIVMLIALLLGLFHKIKIAFQIILAYLLSGLFVQFMKRLLFSHIVRPIKFFEGLEELYFVPEVVVHSSRSFPSGHTASAFVLFFCLIFYVKSLPLKTLFAVLAVLVGFSRIYLSQHFFCDVVAGSFVGVLTSFLVTWCFLFKINPSWLNKPAKILILRHELDT